MAPWEGGRAAYRRVDLAERFSDRAWFYSRRPRDRSGRITARFWIAPAFPPRAWPRSATADNTGWQEVEHPHVWFGKRERDIHDIWHTLTGYTAEEHLGELCLVAFSYAQTRGLGWVAIAAAGALKSVRMTRGTAVLKAVREGYRHGKQAKWLSAEDYEALLAEPLEAARKRLNILPPKLYHAAQAELAEKGVTAI